MMVGELYCNRTSTTTKCPLSNLWKKGERGGKKLARACLSCPASGFRVSSAGKTRGSKGIEYLYKDATTLGKFTDDRTNIPNESKEV